jgi:hypothetical protein
VPLATIQRWLGHHNISQVERVSSSDIRIRVLLVRPEAAAPLPGASWQSFFDAGVRGRKIPRPQFSQPRARPTYLSSRYAPSDSDGRGNRIVRFESGFSRWVVADPGVQRDVENAPTKAQGHPDFGADPGSFVAER